MVEFSDTHSKCEEFVNVFWFELWKSLEDCVSEYMIFTVALRSSSKCVCDRTCYLFTASWFCIHIGFLISVTICFI
jgi:hypothetical protein